MVAIYKENAKPMLLEMQTPTQCEHARVTLHDAACPLAALRASSHSSPPLLLRSGFARRLGCCFGPRSGSLLEQLAETHKFVALIQRA